MSTTARRRTPSDQPLEAWAHARIWLTCGGALLLLHGLAQDPAWVEEVFVPWGLLATGWLTWFTAWLPLALAEILVVLLGVWLIWRTLEGFAEVGAGRRGLLNGLLSAVLLTGDLALFLGAAFYVTWGTAYQRPELGERWGLEVRRAAETDRDALLAMTLAATERTNAAYRKVHGSHDAGVVTEPRKGLDVDAAIERGFERLAADRGLGEDFGRARGPVKLPWISPVLSYLGIAGVFVPFTGEAVVNAGPPTWSRVATAAHEKAHQRLVTREDEATFVGTLALLAADEPLLAYGAWQAVRRHLQAELVRLDPDALDKVAGKLDPGPQRDVVALGAYWERYEGWLQAAQDDVNDLYLRANDVQDGTASYARAVDLLRAWLATPEGRKALGAAAPRHDSKAAGG
ncbi:MAG: DUF3810 domain-containing protein [Alphaproteobacteria bacterium]|nr:DUF3810 domain-containing protein [Alphaproteobacteria bacterium]